MVCNTRLLGQPHIAIYWGSWVDCPIYFRIQEITQETGQGQNVHQLQYICPSDTQCHEWKVAIELIRGKAKIISWPDYSLDMNISAHRHPSWRTCARTIAIQNSSYDGLTQPPGNVDSMQTFQYVDETTRFTKTATGYTLRIQANAIINHLSISGLLVTLGLFYTATIINKQLLMAIFYGGDNVRKQRVCELDLRKHVKED